GDDLGEEVGDAARVLEDLLGAGRLVLEDDLEALVQEGLGVEAEADRLGRHLLLAEDLRVGPEVDRGPRATRRAELLDLRHGLAAFIALLPRRTVALDRRDQLLGERVDDRR